MLSHARALLTSAPEGATAYIDADARDPEKILADPAVRETLDLGQPVALLLVALLHFVPAADDPYAIVTRLLDDLPAGSYLVLSHATFDPFDEATVARLNAVNVDSNPPFCPRGHDEVARFFDGLEMVAPGLVSVSDWRAEPGPRPGPAEAAGYGAVARKPLP